MGYEVTKEQRSIELGTGDNDLIIPGVSEASYDTYG
jgi:hypothetical protein